MNRREILKGAVEGLILVVMGRAAFAVENVKQKTVAHDNIIGATSVQKKLPGRLGRDFGAVGDEVTDATAHIQAAINSGAKTVLVNQ